MKTLENSTFCPRGQKITNVLQLQRGNVFMSSSFSSDSSLHHYRATSSMKYIFEKRAASGICHIFSRFECPPPPQRGEDTPACLFLWHPVVPAATNRGAPEKKNGAPEVGQSREGAVHLMKRDYYSYRWHKTIPSSSALAGMTIKCNSCPTPRHAVVQSTVAAGRRLTTRAFSLAAGQHLATRAFSLAACRRLATRAFSLAAGRRLATRAFSLAAGRRYRRGWRQRCPVGILQASIDCYQDLKQEEIIVRIVQKYISGNGGDTDSREFQRVLVLAADVLTYTEWGEGGERGVQRIPQYTYRNFTQTNPKRRWRLSDLIQTQGGLSALKESPRGQP